MRLLLVHAANYAEIGEDRILFIKENEYDETEANFKKDGLKMSTIDSEPIVENNFWEAKAILEARNK